MGHTEGGSILTDCWNAGDVTGGAHSGIAGSVASSTVINSYSIGTATGNNNATIGWQSTATFVNLYYDNTKYTGGDHSSTNSMPMSSQAFASGEVAALLNANHVEYQTKMEGEEEVSELVNVPASVWSNNDVQPVFADEENYPVYKYVIKGATDGDITVYPKVASSESHILIVASFSGDEMIDVASKTSVAGGAQFSVPADFVKGDNIKIMIWDSFNTAKPLTTISAY